MCKVCFHNRRLYNNDQDHDNRFVHRSLRFSYAKRIHGGCDCLDCIRAYDGTCQVEPAASQAIASQRHSENGIQFQIQTYIV